MKCFWEHKYVCFSQCDDTPLELPQLEGIAVVNIPSVYGGANLWGETDKKKARRSRAKSGGRGNDLEWAVQGVLSSPNSLGVKSTRFSVSVTAL